MRIWQKNSRRNLFWDILDDFRKIDFFAILVVKITLKMYKKSKFSKKTLCTKSVILTLKMPILNFLMTENEDLAKKWPQKLILGHFGRFWKNRYFLPHKSAKMSGLTLNWPLQAALKKSKIGLNTRFLECFHGKPVFGLV